MILALVASLLLACSFAPSPDGAGEKAWVAATPASGQARLDCAAAEPAPEIDEIHEDVQWFGATAPIVAPLASPCLLARAEGRCEGAHDATRLISAIPRAPPVRL